MLTQCYHKTINTISQWFEIFVAISQPAPVPVKVLSRRAEAQRVLELQQYRNQCQKLL